MMRKGSYSEELVRIVRAMNSKEIDAPTAILIQRSPQMRFGMCVSSSRLCTNGHSDTLNHETLCGC